MIKGFRYFLFQLLPKGITSYFFGILLLICLLAISYTSAQTPPYIKNFPSNIYKASPSVFNVVKDNFGLIYFGTNKGVVIFDGARWETINVSNYSDVKCLELGPDGKVYVGANGNFGYIENNPTQGFQYVSLSDSLPPYETNFNDVWQIVFLKNDIYFQTYSGIFKWDQVDITFNKIQEAYIFNIDDKLYGSNYLTGSFGLYKNGKIEPVRDYKKLQEDFVFQVLEYDSTHHILATSQNGLFLFNDKNEQIESFVTPANAFLKKNSYYEGLRINEDLYGLGSWDGGIIFMDKAGNLLHSLDQETGLYANHIYDIILGENNDLWLATNNGISKIDLDSLRFNQEVAVRKPKNPLLKKINASFGNENTELSLPNYFSVENQENYELRNKILNLYQLPSSLSFYYAAPCFAGEETLYSVFLEGYDKKWSDWKSEAVKEYTNLGGGNYTFYLQAKNEFSNEFSEIVTININIYTPWYHSTWLKVLIGFFIAFGLFIVIRLMLLRLKTQNTRLENIVNERTQDLIEQQKKLSELNKSLSITNKELDNFVYHTSHDLRAPLKSVLGLVDLAKREDINGKFSPYHNRMEMSILKLEEFISSIIQYSSNSKADVHIKTINFKEIVQNSINELQFHEAFDKIIIKKNIVVEKDFYSDEKRIQIIFNNLISNAVKYYDKQKSSPEIIIEISSTTKGVEFSIADNGIGIRSDLKDKVFVMFFRASENSYGSGLGLYIIKETVKKLNGTINMSSEEGKFTRFTVELPNLKQQVAV